EGGGVAPQPAERVCVEAGEPSELADVGERALGVDPRSDRIGERGTEPDRAEKAPKRGDLQRIGLSATQQVVEVEEPLLVADSAGEGAELHVGRRQPRSPELALVVARPRARVFGEN